MDISIKLHLKLTITPHDKETINLWIINLHFSKL